MNGKGDRPRKKSVDNSTWEKNWNRIFKKNYGVKVEVNMGDGTTCIGYIIRRINIDNYEVWCEDQQRTLFLCQNEFREVG